MSNSFGQEDWVAYARSYDAILHLRPYVSMLREVVDAVNSRPHALVLDASCGTGNLEKTLFESSINDCYIVGIDMAGAMLDRAKNKCAHWKQVSFHATDLNVPLVFESNIFAQVVSINTLYALTNPEMTLSEFHRVLAPGGHLVLVTPHKDYENGLILKEHCASEHPDEYWAHVHASPEREEKLIREALNNESLVSDMLTVARFNRDIAATSSFHFYNPLELVLLLESVGFSIERQSSTYAHQDNFIIATKGVCSCKRPQ